MGHVQKRERTREKEGSRDGDENMGWRRKEARVLCQINIKSR